MQYKCFGNISITNIVLYKHHSDMWGHLRCSNAQLLPGVDILGSVICRFKSPICHCGALLCLDLCIHTVPHSASQPVLALGLWQPTPWESSAVHMVTVLLQEIKHITISQVNLINCHHTDENYLKWWQIAFHCMPETKAFRCQNLKHKYIFSMCSRRKINVKKNYQILY